MRSLIAWSGIVKVNVEPLPGSLSSQMRTAVQLDEACA